MRLLLDTCVLSELRKPDREELVVRIISALPDQSLYVSVLTVGEIVKGIALLDESNMTHIDQTIQEICQNVVATLPLSDRLRLAALILNELTQQNAVVIDASNTWTEQDQFELTSFSLQHANSLFPPDL